MAVFVGEVTVDGETLCVTVGLMFKNDLKPTYDAYMRFQSLRGIPHIAHLCDYFAHLSEIGASPNVALCQEVLDEACANVVPHLLQLLIYLVVVFIVLDELHDQCTICEGKQLCVLPLTSGQIAYCAGTKPHGSTYDLLGPALPNVLTDGLVLLARRRHD